MNFSNGDHIISVTDKTIPLSPISIALYDSDLFESIRKCSTLTLPRELKDCDFESVDTAIETLQPPDPQIIESFVEKVLTRTRYRRGIVQTFHQQHTDVFASSFKNILNEFKKAIQLCDTALFEVNIKKLVGLGSGLTPSGDDFIYGFLATTRTFSILPDFAIKIEEVIDNNKNRFGDLSYSFLKALREGHIYYPLKEMFRCLDSKRDYDESVDKLLEYGVYSGSDILAGVLFGMQYMSNSKH